jgi:hypothetical protein
MTELTGKVGFASPITEQKFSTRRTAGIELMATLALAVCLVVAATAVSINVAFAQSLGSVGVDGRAPCAIATLLVLFFAGMGGMTFITLRERR